MRVAVLTTDTPHHTYFVWQLSRRLELVGLVLETSTLQPPFETEHPFERERDDYEREVLLAECTATIEELAPAVTAESANDAPALDALQRLEPELVFVFGTGVLGARVLEAIPGPVLNLHGGNPEQYRGLDTHLWAIYHRDFPNLVTTLHHVDSGLDTGRIVSSEEIELSRDMRLHQLRARNTEVCVRLALEAAGSLSSGERIAGREQRAKGRYYSFMPAVLKDVCVRHFDSHVASL